MQPSDTSPCRSFVFPGKQNSPQLEEGEIDEIDELDEIDEMDEMDSDSPTGSPTGSPSKNKSGGEVEMLNQMLEVERAGLVAAKSELV